MTKAEFKRRWELDDKGDGLTMDEVAECAKSWGLYQRPRTSPMQDVLYSVLKAADVNDADEYKPRTKPLESAPAEPDKVVRAWNTKDGRVLYRLRQSGALEVRRGGSTWIKSSAPLADIERSPHLKEIKL